MGYLETAVVALAFGTSAIVVLATALEAARLRQPVRHWLSM